MGLDQIPTLRDYYSKKVLYKSELPKVSRISRNRCETLLHFLHISDNENCPPVNDMAVFKEVTGNNMSVTDLGESIVCAFLGVAVERQTNTGNQVQHIIKEKQSRGRCSACYKSYSETEGCESAIKKAKKSYRVYQCGA
nr:unnamed protein product [Callosobruchus chinensis]